MSWNHNCWGHSLDHEALALAAGIGFGLGRLVGASGLRTEQYDLNEKQWRSVVHNVLIYNWVMSHANKCASKSNHSFTASLGQSWNIGLFRLQIYWNCDFPVNKNNKVDCMIRLKP